MTDHAANSHPPSPPKPVGGDEGDRTDDPLLRDLIGQALRRARKAQGRTLREVADDAQVSLPYLSEIERGRKEPSSEVLAAVNRALGIGLDELLGTLTADLRPVASVVSLHAMRASRHDGSSAMLLAA